MLGPPPPPDLIHLRRACGDSTQLPSRARLSKERRQSDRDLKAQFRVATKPLAERVGIQLQHDRLLGSQCRDDTRSPIKGGQLAYKGASGLLAEGQHFSLLLQSL